MPKEGAGFPGDLFSFKQRNQANPIERLVGRQLGMANFTERRVKVDARNWGPVGLSRLDDAWPVHKKGDANPTFVIGPLYPFSGAMSVAGP